MGEHHGGQQLATPPAEGGTGRAVEAEVLDALGELFGQIKAHVTQLCRPFQLAPPYAIALRHVDGTISMKELGQQMHCDPSFVTTIADELEQRGLVRREIDRDDRRIKNLVLTDAGIDLRSRLEKDFFSALPGVRHLDAQECGELLQLLRKMVTAEQGAGTDAGGGGAVSRATGS